MNLLLRSLFVVICLGLFAGCSITITNGNNNNDEQETTEETHEKGESENSNNTGTDEGNNLNQNENSDTPADENSAESDTPDEKENNESNEDEIVAQNEAFKVYEPAPDAQVSGEVVVHGLARVFEGTVQYSFEDGHIIYDQGFTTAHAGGPEWGEFEISIDLAHIDEGDYRVVLFELSAKDGSVVHELIIPVHVK